MHSKIKVGIAGYGIVGKRRGEYIRKNSDMKLIAICDKNLINEGVEDDVKYYKNYKNLLTKDIDALFVCLTNDVVAKVTIEGLKAGLHVFCEKPPAQNVKQMREVNNIQKQYPHLKLKYGFNHRYHESVREAYRIIKNGELGRVVDCIGIYGKSKVVTATGPNADWRSKRKVAGGGILLDQGIHMVDLIRFFTGEYEEFHSFISNKYWNYDAEDNAYALMRNANGVVALLHSSATQWRHDFSLRITLERGSLLLKGILSGSKSYGAETLNISLKQMMNLVTQKKNNKI